MTPEEIEAEYQRRIQELMDADYPIPDPAWDYAEVWPQAWKLRQQVNALVGLMETTEEATPDIDLQLKAQLAIAQQLIGEIQAKLKQIPPF